MEGGRRGIGEGAGVEDFPFQRGEEIEEGYHY